jgi:uncharacterized phage-associated protein
MENMAYSPLAIANTFVAKYGGSDDLSHMKLQKLVFYAYGWWLAYHDEPLVAEGPEVWKFGPVFSSLYSALAQNGMSPIDEPKRAVPIGKAPIVPDDAEEAIDLIDWVWDRYGSCTAGQLSEMTHKPGTPWQVEAAARQYKVPRSHKIPDEIIKDYFKGLATKLESPSE